jgi:hypothetical protein
LNEGAEVETGGEVKAGVDEGVEDGIDVAVGVNVGVEQFLLVDWGLKFVQVLGYVRVGVFKLGVQVCAFKLGCSGGCVLWILGFHSLME